MIRLLSATCLSWAAISPSPIHGGVPADAPRPANQGVWSSETNSLAVALSVRHPGQEYRYELTVAFRQTSSPTNQLIAQALPGPIGATGRVHRPYAPGARYFLSTNSYWGPMQLYDSSGRPVSPVDKQTGAVEPYPISYSLWAANTSLMGQYQVYSGLPLPIAIRPNAGGSVYDLGKFFKLSRAGHYRLKLWPKIYIRDGPGTDTCSRLDLAPVTVEFDVD